MFIKAMRHVCCCTLILVACFKGAAHASLLPPSFVNAVVSIGHTEPNPNGPPVWITEASGFFYGYLVQDDPDPAKRQYEIYLVTNRHVIANHSVVFIRLNPKQTSDQGQVFDAPMTDEHGMPTWFTHRDQNIDIAAIRINWKLLQDRGIDVDFMTSDTHAADTKKMQDIGVSAGDGIFVIGFPMNLAGQQRNYAIVRPGAIARVSDLIQSAATELLIDSHVFPGNSGGPVILEPNSFSIQGTKSNNTAYLIGMVRGFISYIDTAISTQTQRPRVTFEENSGLAEVVPVDRINEAIKTWRDSLPSATQVPLKPAPEKQ
jgi:S1-C subfamily serine protease